MADSTGPATGSDQHPARVGVADTKDVLRRGTLAAGQPLEGLEALPGGTSSLTYSARTGGGTRVVVKVAPPGLDPVRNRNVLRQARVLTALAEVADAPSRRSGAGGGSIINISSSGALMPQPRFGPYASAKAALNALTTVFALEYAPTVRVNTISAGPFLTDIADAWPPEARERTRSAAGRPGRPSEIVTTALYLASAASSYTTGALIRVDGGLF